MLKRWLIAASLLAGPAAHAAPPMAASDDPGVRTSGNGWTYWRVGNPTDVTTTTQGGIGFEGGGTDVNDLYRWLCAKAGNGDVLVLNAYGGPAYNPYIHRLCPSANSVATLRITSRIGASDPFVAGVINQAEAVFIQGGAQNNYIAWWHRTPVEDALNDLPRRNVTVAGTSAGNSILGRYAFSAWLGTITSPRALKNCYAPRITINDDFLRLNRLTHDVITDDHFVTRHRMGRLVTFLARIALDGKTPLPLAIATNENTAFLMEPDGRGRVVGGSDAYFLRTSAAPEICAADTPVTNTGIEVIRVSNGQHFDTRRWDSGDDVTRYTISATAGVLSSTQAHGKIY